MGRITTPDLAEIFGGFEDRVAQVERLLRATLSKLSPELAQEIVVAVGSAFNHDITGPEHLAFPGGTTTFLRGDATFAAPVHEVRDEGIDQGDAGTFDFVGAGVTAAVAGGVATITVSGGGGSADEPTVTDWFLT